MAQLHFGAGDSSTFGTTTGGSGTATLVKSNLSNMQIGDLLVAWIHNQSSGVGDTITAPTGWVHYGAAIGNPNMSVSRLSGFYYYPLKTQADIDAISTSSVWIFSQSATRVGCVVARATGIDLDNIEDSAATSFTSAGGTTSSAIIGINTVKATTLLVGGIHHQNSASTTSPTTTNFMTAFQEYKTAPTGSALANTGSVMGYTNLTAAGPTGNITATYDTATTAAGGELVAFKVGTWTPAAPISSNPTVVGASTTFVSPNTQTSFTINKPTGYQNGDVLIMALAAQTPTATSDFACSGWSRISQPFISSSAGTRIIAFYALPVPTASLLTQTTFTFTSTDSATAGRICAEIFIVRGADLSNLVSSISPYGTASGQVVTVQPASPSVNNNLLLVGYNANFTSAIDYTIASGPSGMTQQASLISSTAAQSKTALAVYYQNIDSGAVAGKTLTWAGVQSQSAGVSVAIRALGQAAPNAGIALKYTSAPDTLSTAHLYYTSATDTISTPKEVRPVPTGYSSVTSMLATTPFYVAHRGGSADWPEMSLHAYTQSAFWGVGALELSLARTSDGVWFGLHDATLDRTSGTTNFTASAHTWAEVQAYLITAAGTTSTPQVDKPYMRWEEIMAAYYNTHIIFIDPKVASGYINELLAMMDAQSGTPTNRFVAKYYGIASAWPNAAHAHGYKTWGYFYQADVPNLAAYQGYWDILGMDVGADQPSWDAIKSYGKKVIGHIPATLSSSNSGFSKGADAMMCAGVTEIIPRTL
ncbi:MAG: glycerophosphodiester phosphodiesterase family protein [Candidatus Saccharimonadales bacterium]